LAAGLTLRREHRNSTVSIGNYDDRSVGLNLRASLH
jgi:hypothetical protein